MSYNACPFECCQFGEWVAKDSVDLVDKPNGTTKVATIGAHEKVTALTGEVHVVPRPVLVVYPMAEGPKAGDVVWLLDYLGEGFSRFWWHGQTASAFFSPQRSAFSLVSHVLPSTWSTMRFPRGGTTGGSKSGGATGVSGG